MKPYRSVLFMPGHRPELVAKGIASGADAIVLDLEDAVPDADKVAARSMVAVSIDRVRADGTRCRPVRKAQRLGHADRRLRPRRGRQAGARRHLPAQDRFRRRRPPLRGATGARRIRGRQPRA